MRSVGQIERRIQESAAGVPDLSGAPVLRPHRFGAKVELAPVRSLQEAMHVLESCAEGNDTRGG